LGETTLFRGPAPLPDRAFCFISILIFSNFLSHQMFSRYNRLVRNRRPDLARPRKLFPLKYL
jgi:hypothetical protein